MIREMKTLNNINLLSPSCWKELFVLLTIFSFCQKSHSKKHNNKKTQSLTHGVFSDPSSPGLDLLWSPFGSSMFMLFLYSVGKWQDSWERKGNLCWDQSSRRTAEELSQPWSPFHVVEVVLHDSETISDWDNYPCPTFPDFHDVSHECAEENCNTFLAGPTLDKREPWVALTPDEAPQRLLEKPLKCSSAWEQRAGCWNHTANYLHTESYC